MNVLSTMRNAPNKYSPIFKKSYIDMTSKQTCIADDSLFSSCKHSTPYLASLFALMICLLIESIRPAQCSVFLLYELSRIISFYFPKRIRPLEEQFLEEVGLFEWTVALKDLGDFVLNPFDIRIDFGLLFDKQLLVLLFTSHSDDFFLFRIILTLMGPTRPPFSNYNESTPDKIGTSCSPAISA